MLHKLMIGVLGAVPGMFSTAALAQGTAVEAKAMLEKAVAAVKADKAKALDMFNKGEGGFLDRDLYVFCSNVSDGKLLADGNPNAKRLIGTDDRTLKDSTGKAFGEQMFQMLWGTLFFAAEGTFWPAEDCGSNRKYVITISGARISRASSVCLTAAGVFGISATSINSLRPLNIDASLCSGVRRSGANPLAPTRFSLTKRTTARHGAFPLQGPACVQTAARSWALHWRLQCRPYLHGVLRHRPETFVGDHKFKIGQLVYYLGRDRAPGVYQVTQLLPPEGEVFQYRIRNVNEPHERVAKENELRRA